MRSIEGKSTPRILMTLPARDHDYIGALLRREASPSHQRALHKAPSEAFRDQKDSSSSRACLGVSIHQERSVVSPA